MWRYHLQMAVKSLRRDPFLSSIVVGTISLGIGVCMTTLTLFYISSQNPIPTKSERLISVRLNNWPEGESMNADETPGFDITYGDAVKLLEHQGGIRQAAGYNTAFVVHPDNSDLRPYRANVRLTSGDFFPMFDVGFQYGSAWSTEQEDQQNMVAVLSASANDKLFGGIDSVGQEVRLQDWTFIVGGVLEPWKPLPKFYDLNSGTFSDPEEIFVPFSLTPVLEARKNNGSTSCFEEIDGNTWQAFLESECIWVQYWAEIPSATAKADYESHLEAYIAGQRDLGRYPREKTVWAQDVMTLFKDFGVVDDDSRVLLGLAFMFLAVCLVNVVGLLLDKFMLRPGELAVRRALGARRRTLLAQRLCEVALLGLAGAGLGLGLAWIGLWMLRNLNISEELTRLDPTLAMVAVVLSIGSSVLAGLYPAWRSSRIPPARYLRT